METSIGVEHLIPLALVAFGAGIINGTTGLGFAVGGGTALALIFGPKVSVILLSIVTPLLATQQIHRNRAQANLLPRLAPVLLAGAVGAILGTQLLVLLPSFALSLLLGAFTVWYVSTALAKRPMRIQPGTERFVSPIVGLIAGVSNGSVGASGPVVGSYFMSMGLQPRQFVFAVSTMFASLGVVRFIGLAALSQYTVLTFATSLGLFVPAYAGQRFGFWLQGRLPQSLFQRVILVVLLVASILLLRRGFEGVQAVLPAAFLVGLPW